VSRCTYYGPSNLEALPEIARLSASDVFAMKVVAAVLPFRTNSYVVRELIDWGRAPDDPLFRLTFMHRDMLDPDSFAAVAGALRRGAPVADLEAIVRRVRAAMNPHPGGQLTHNRVRHQGELVPGIQHKYPETVLVFPAAGQTCFAYCTFCFRWPQFVGDDALRLATDRGAPHLDYLRAHREVSDVLVTGGDPMIMRAPLLRRTIEPLLAPGLEHLQTIRIGTKALGFWPYRFTTDPDADDVLRLFEMVVRSGRRLALMAHVSHPRELGTEAARDAIARIRATGAMIWCQSPVLRTINDAGDTWAAMWREQVHLGMVPYYMFVERDTGPKAFFEIPLVRALAIYRDAYRQVSGLARTARGPVMSAFPGKVSVDGVAELGGQKVLTLSFVQARDPSWCRIPFFARYEEHATWLDQLRPAAGAARFFFADETAEAAPAPRTRLAVL
jgi:KamA family protein